MPVAPIHLRPQAPLAERALLPGDPGRALMLAQALLEAPRMFNHHRGLWGYTGLAADGQPLTIQSTGMGGPSAAIVLEELIDLGLRRAIRVGTCGALEPRLKLGQLLVVGEAHAEDGASRALGAGARLHADGALRAALEAAAPAAPVVNVVSTDLFYEAGPSRWPRLREAGAVAVEMEAAALFAVGRRRGAAVACLLVVSDLLDGDRRRIADEALEQAGRTMGATALAALAE